MDFRGIKLFLLLIYLFNAPIYSVEIVDIASFGAVPNSKTNVIPLIDKALEYCKGKDNVILSFPKGRYDFWPSEYHNKSYDIGFCLFKQRNLIIEGNDSEFIFHGRMQISDIDSCANIIFRNFSVDWDRPFISQGEIVECSDSFLEMKIDRERYPFIIEKSKLLFLGEGWKLPVLTAYNNAYDKDTKEIVYNTWDNPLGNIFSQEVEDRGGGILRFLGKPPVTLEKGTFISLFHERYAVVGFHIRNSRDITLKDLKIYHALSHGVLGERTENITMDNASMLVNESKGRVFSIIADASHFINCKGVIKIENCAHTGQGDDFINVHGKNIAIERFLNNKTIVLKNTERMKGSWRYITVGDDVWLINKETAQREYIRTIESVKPIDDVASGYKVSFTQELPKGMDKIGFLENKTWNASLELRHCKILKKHRARGILVTTPENVIIEDNYFRTAGTAILIEGDLDFWYESGANTNVKIQNNIFEDCLTSGNAHGNRGEWGEAVITITPSHKPTTDKDIPYHKNIFICNNTFKVFDAPLLRARSVGGLSFINNEIIKTYTYKPYTWQKSSFLLDGCRNVIIMDNLIDQNYKTRNIQIEHMRKNDIKVSKKAGFSIDFLRDINTHMEW